MFPVSGRTQISGPVLEPMFDQLEDLRRILWTCANALSHEKHSVHIAAPPKVMINRAVAMLTA